MRRPDDARRVRVCGPAPVRDCLTTSALARVCGIAPPLAWGGQQVPDEPIFTPATKAELGGARREHRFAEVVEPVARCAPTSCAIATLQHPRPGLPITPRPAGDHRRQLFNPASTRRHDGCWPRSYPPRLVAVLERGQLPAGRGAGQLRQAVRPQLAHLARIGLGPQRNTATTAACHPRSSMPLARVTSKPTNVFRACGSPTGSGRP